MAGDVLAEEMVDHWVGLSTVLGIIDKGEPILRWANKHGLAGRTLEEARSTQGRHAGTTAHRLLTGQGTVPIDWTPFAKPINAWLDRASEVLVAEQTIRSERLHVTGRPDAIRRCDRDGCHCFGEGGIVVDFKTYQGDIEWMRSYFEQHVQVDGYLEIWPDTGRAPRHLCGGELVLLPENGMPVVTPCRVPRGTFLNALGLWRARSIFLGA